MNKVIFKAFQRFTGEHGTITLKLAELFTDEQDEEEHTQAVLEARQVRQFLKDKVAREGAQGHEQALLVTMEPYYRKASANQWRLLMIMVHRLAGKQGVDYKQIYAGIRYQYFAKEYDEDGHGVPKSSDTLTTRELHQAIEGAVIECAENGVDVADIYVLWSNWRNTRKGGDPLKDDYKDEADYVRRHPVCEACGRGLAKDPKEGQLAHIDPNDDALSKRFRFCTECHMMTQHQKGWEVLIGKYPHIAGKVKAAKEVKI